MGFDQTGASRTEDAEDLRKSRFFRPLQHVL